MRAVVYSMMYGRFPIIGIPLMVQGFMDKEMPYIDENLERIHEAGANYAVEVNLAISEQSKRIHPYPLAGGALYRLQADTLSFS